MKIGIIAESLHLPLYDSLKKAAELGVHGVQLHALHPAHNLPQFSPKELKQLRAFCENQNLKISAVCGDIPGHGFRGGDEVFSKIEIEKRIIDTALELGTSIITTHIGVVPEDSSHPDYQPMAEAIGALGYYAKNKGAVLAIETGPERPQVLLDFIHNSGTDGLGVNMDPANLVMVWDEDPVAAVYLLGKHIVHTHVKDGIHHQKCDPEKVYSAFAEGGFEQLVAETGELFTEVPPGQGQVRWPQYLQALKDVGFNGFLTIEREVGDDPMGDIKTAINFISSEMKQIADSQKK